jgi:hypothetical protein
MAMTGGLFGDQRSAVNSLYLNYLGRPLDDEGAAWWLGDGQGTLEDIENNIKMSSEYQSRNADAQGRGWSTGALYTDDMFSGNNLTASGLQGSTIAGYVPPQGSASYGPYGSFDGQGNPLWDPNAPRPNSGGGGALSQYQPQETEPIRPVGYDLDFSNLGDPVIERQRVEDALMARLNPQLDRTRNLLETRLANQGLTAGGEAYNEAIDEANRAANDMRLAAVMNAGAEQSRLFGLGLSQAAFRNAAQGQEFDQGLANANLANATQAQAFQQALMEAEFANRARQQAIQESLLERQTPLNEIAALISGAQIGQPNFANTPMTNLANTDVTSPIYANYQGALNNYNQQLQSRNAFWGGLFGLGGTLGGALLL